MAQDLDAPAFLHALEGLDGTGIRRLARSLESDLLTDEVDWWRATIAIDKVLRHSHNTRQAAYAAARASHAVQDAATRAGIPLPDADVTHVARAAADVARGLAAGRAARPVVRLLLEHWSLLDTVHV